MINEAQAADEWLLERYDDVIVPAGNHIRPIFQLLDDYPSRSTERSPRMNSPAAWPLPVAACDLDALDSLYGRLPTGVVPQ